MSWKVCPNCHENTAYDTGTYTRCIPCGYGISPRLSLATPEQSRKNAALLRGDKK